MFEKYVDAFGICCASIAYLLISAWVIANSELIGLSNIIYFDEITLHMLFMISFLAVSMIGISLVSSFMNEIKLFVFKQHKQSITLFALLLSAVPLNIFMMMVLIDYQNIYINILMIGLYISMINSAFAYLMVRCSVGICWNVNYGLNRLMLAMKR